MRTLATIAAFSLAASFQVATDNTPSSFVIDLLEESQVVDKEIDEIETLDDFETAPESSLTSARRTSLTRESQPGGQDDFGEQERQVTSEEQDQVVPDNSPKETEGTDEITEKSQDPEDPHQKGDSESDTANKNEPEREGSTRGSEAQAYTLLTDPLETEGFQVAGVTWQGAPPQQVDVRALSNGEWTEWFNLEIDESNGGQDGTEPIMAAGSEGIQVRATGKVLPDVFDVHLMTGEGSNGTELDSNPREAQDLPDQGTELEQAKNVSFKPTRDNEKYLLARSTGNANDGMQLASTQRAANLQSVPFSQNIVSRTEWGAPRQATWRTQYAPLQGAIIHHTAGSNNYNRNQAPSIVKGIWNYHTYNRGWGDIGYNFLVDKFGTVYEGRSGSTIAKPGEMAIGAHAAPANTGSVGISVLGSYTGSVNPSNLVLDTISDLVAWQFAMADIDPTGKFTYRTANGSSSTTDAVSGHRDISATLCPGNIYPRLGTIRTSAASKMSQYNPGSTPTYVRVQTSGNGWPLNESFSMGDFSGNGTTDLALKNPSGLLFLYKGRGDNTFANGVQIGHGWNGFKHLHGGVDFDGDTVPDLLAVNSNNQLYLYPGNGSGRFKKARQIGHGWSFKHLIVFQNGPSKNPAIAGIRANGSMTVYATNGHGRFTTNNTLTAAGSNFKNAIAVGDWDRSGYSDLVTITPSGRLNYYADPTENNFSDGAQIGRGWAGLTIIPGDSKEGYHDLITVSPNGQLNTYMYQH